MSRKQSAFLLFRFCIGVFAANELLLGQTQTAIDGSTPPAVAAGQPAGSYLLSGFETVNLYNGALSLNLPLVDMKGRGQTSVSVELSVQRRWVMENISPTGATGTQSYAAIEIGLLQGGVYGSVPEYSPGTMSAREVGSDIFANCSPSGAMYQTTLTRLTFTEANGTQHDFVDALSGGQFVVTNPVTAGDPNLYQCVGSANTTRGRAWVTRDGTFWTFILDADTIKDGTGVTYSAPPVPSGADLTGNLYLKDGTVYRLVSGRVDSVRDRNGNTVHYAYGTDTFDPASYNRVVAITDTVGRSVSIAYAQDFSTPTVFDRYDIITYPSSSGTQPIKVHYCYLDPSLLVDPVSGLPTPKTCPHYSPTVTSTYHGLFGHESSSSTAYNPVSVSYVELPDSRRYEFSYNAYGEVAKVKLPTGGSFQYSYGPGDPSVGTAIDPQGGGVIGLANLGASLQIYRRVTQRSVYLDDATLEGKTVYQTAYTPNCFAGIDWCTTVAATHQDPALKAIAAERHYFYEGANNPNDYFFNGRYYPRWQEGREYQTDLLTIPVTGTFDPMTATALKREAQVWEQRACDTGEPCPGPWGSPVDVRTRERDTTLVDSGQTSSQTLAFDRYNNVVQRDESGYGGGLPRRTTAHYLASQVVNSNTWDYQGIPLAQSGTYGSFSGDYSKILHIRDLPDQQSVFDSSGTIEVARTSYGYDNYTSNPPYTAPLLSRGALFALDNTVPPVRGNVTKISSWLISSGSPTGSLDVYRQYDAAGNVVNVLDAMGKSTGIDYSLTCSAAFPTTVTNALGQKVQSLYNCNTGKVTQFTGLNGEITGYRYDDPLDRLTEADFPDGGITKFGYCDSGSTATCPTAVQNSVTRTVTQNSCQATNSVVTDSVYDGLGRPSVTHAYEASDSILVQTIYDAMGRVYQVSNPSLGQPANWTTTSYDSLSRVIQVQTPDLATVNTSYTGNTVTVRDQSANLATGQPGRWRQSQMDALGRLTQVIEDPSASLKLPDGTTVQNSPVATATTIYTYDALDDLLQVNQSGQLRTFAYDSLKRLTCASNPETRVGTASCPGLSGVDTYTYDANGNLWSHTNTLPVTTTMAYDSLNRLIQKAYSDNTTPTVNLCYDGNTTATPNNGTPAVSCIGAASLSNVNAVGHLTWEGNGNSSTSFTAFDAMGRVLTHTQATPPAPQSPFTFQYAYSKSGQLESMTYPGRRQVVTCYDTAGRVSSVQHRPLSGNPTNYATVNQYAPHGAITQMTLGNQLVEQTLFNARLQPCAIRVGSLPILLQACPADLTGLPTGGLLNLVYGYGGTNNNGNLLSQQIGANDDPTHSLSWTQGYGYDSLNRLTTASETALTLPTGVAAQPWNLTNAYDQYGNRSQTALWEVGGLTPIASTQFSTATNRLKSLNDGTPLLPTDYDAAGNLQHHPSLGQMVYDAENRLVRFTPFTSGGANVTTYVYDGEGQRVSKTFAGMTNSTSTYVYDATGQLAAEYTTASFPDSNTSYLTADHLGSTRLVTDKYGTPTHRFDYLPFGEDLSALGLGNRSQMASYFPSSIPTIKFTGKERGDPTMEGGLDYFGARYFSGAQGRFTSPDAPLVGQHQSNPQSWNMYAYGLNNPLRYVDPTGNDPDPADKSPECAADPHCLASPPPPPPPANRVDAAIGGGKQLLNELIGAGNLALRSGDLAAPQIPLLSPTNADQQAGMKEMQLTLMMPGPGIMLLPEAGAQIVVNLGGEGEALATVNVQPARIGGSVEQALLNARRVRDTSGQFVVMAEGDMLPFRNGGVNTVITNNVPIDRGTTFFGPSFTTKEILRILNPNNGAWIGTSAPPLR